MTERKTALNRRHREMGARMVPFAGWDMPVNYSSIIEEHLRVRSHVGLFDVSHMGEIHIQGEDAISFTDSLTCNRVSDIVDGQVQYNAILNPTGGVVDDITIYRVSDTELFIVSNASNYEKVYRYIKPLAPSNVIVEDQSDRWNQLAIQGPDADQVLSSLLQRDLRDIKYYHFKDILNNNETLRISRTGYTGEDGFEIYASADRCVRLWDEILEAGKSNEILPVGLGARDTLRLESMYPLYGHELSEEWSPVESGIGWVVKEKSKPYPGYERIIKDKKNGSEFTTAGFILEEAGVPREGYDVLASDAKTPIGRVLSGTHSPSLKKGIGSSRIPSSYKKDEVQIYINIRNRPVKALLHKGAFVKGGAGKTGKV